MLCSIFNLVLLGFICFPKCKTYILVYKLAILKPINAEFSGETESTDINFIHE